MTERAEVSELTWRRIWPPDPAILRGVARDLAVEEIDPSVSAINPPMEAAIRLGLWLAVEDPGLIVARASIGDFVWSETTARVESVSFDMGDGEVVTCDGVGTPIDPDELDTLDQGPCGHTYLEVGDLDVESIGITTTWAVSWRDSWGRSGTFDSVVDEVSVPYGVYEIVTVGRG